MILFYSDWITVEFDDYGRPLVEARLIWSRERWPENLPDYDPDHQYPRPKPFTGPMMVFGGNYSQPDIPGQARMIKLLGLDEDYLRHALYRKVESRKVSILRRLTSKWKMVREAAGK